MDEIDLQAIADELVGVYDTSTMVAPITERWSGFDSTGAYKVLGLITAERNRRGWTPVGRKIGFTNRTIWDLYNVDRPMWAHVWDRTVRLGASHGSVSLGSFVQPRIEPEVVFGLKGPIPATDDPEAVLGRVEWIAPGFEIVQCHFPDWKFTAADCTAAFGLHAALMVGRPVPITDQSIAAVARMLAAFELTLCRDGSVVDTGLGANVLGSPALALAHLARVLVAEPGSPPLVAGEIVTTGTLTNAWPIRSGEHWTADYGQLGLEPLSIEFS